MKENVSPEELFRRNSRSFSMAARLLRPEDQHAVARLYRFCRYMDDLADDTKAGDPGRLQLARDRLLDTRAAPDGSIESDMHALATERTIPPAPALHLIEALRADCGERSIQSEAGLIQFAYGVAGTVGQMMRYVIGAHDRRAEAFSIDLGIALQLSNVIRDVAEDAGRGRFYLPSAWIRPSQIDAALSGDAEAAHAVDAAVQRVFDLAELYYESAFRGLAYIPGRNRCVIFLAAAFYRAIGQKVIRRSPDGWKNRTVVSPLEKLGILMCFPYRYWRAARMQWRNDPEPEHDSRLHASLSEKPWPLPTTVGEAT